MSPRFALPAAALVSAYAACTPAAAQDSRFDIALRARMTIADGQPANDIPGYGMQAHYALSENWAVGAAVDRLEYDFEEPAKLLGIAQDPTLEPIDAVAEATVLSLWLERRFWRPSAKTFWFVSAGLGASFVDVPEVTGPSADGGTFDIRTTTDTELIASVAAGVQRRFGERWLIEFALRGDQHFADWQSSDRVSGATSATGDYLAWGGHLAFGFRW